MDEKELRKIQTETAEAMKVALSLISEAADVIAASSPLPKEAKVKYAEGCKQGMINGLREFLSIMAVGIRRTGQ